MIQAVEAMTPERRPVPCEKCGKDTGPRPTKTFREFLDRYAPQGGAYDKTRIKLYKTRSRIAHGGVLSSDVQVETGTGLGALTPDWGEQHEQMDAAHHLARLALVGWLHTQGHV